MIYLAAGIFIQNIKLPFPGIHMVIVFARHSGYLIIEKPCGVDHIGRDYFFPGGCNGLNLVIRYRHTCYFGAQKERRPIGLGVFRIGHHQQERIDDTFPWNIKTGLHIGTEIGFYGQKLFSGEVFHIIDPVFKSLFLEGRKLLKLFTGKSGQNSPNLGEWYIQIPAKFFIHGIGGNYQFRFQSTWGCVISGMNNCAVGFGGQASHILIFINHQNPRLVFSQFPGYGAAHRTSADHQYIGFYHSNPFLFFYGRRRDNPRRHPFYGRLALFNNPVGY